MTEKVNQDWPHQTRGLQGLAQAVRDGKRTILGVAPPGAGKSRMMIRIATEAVEQGETATIYLHRQMLLEQLSNELSRQGIEHGIQASGYEPDFNKPLQISMTDTMFSRAVKKGKWELPKSKVVIFDEAHQQTSAKAMALVFGSIKDTSTTDGHFDHKDCTVYGFTGTPVNCGVMYEHIVGFGTYKELRNCNAHLPIRVYSPSEISTKGLVSNTEGDFSEKSLEPRAAKIISSAYDGWKRLNPQALPAILFGPSVGSARWFCHEWMKKGVHAAHIDGEVCLIPRCFNGTWTLEQVPSDKDARAEVLRMSESGEVKLITNRFVLREAIDMPWLFHGIGATVFGSESTYLQSVGRIQRFHENYAFKVWQDHGGGFWRHGSPNMERDWTLGCTNKERAKQRIEAAVTAKNPQDVEGIQCPKCNGWRTHGDTCPHCGNSHKRSVRAVMEIDGTLELMQGSVNKKRKKAVADIDRLWTSTLYSCGARGVSVASAVAQFYQKCESAGIQFPSVKNLASFRPPEKTDLNYHRSVTETYPWAARKYK